MKIPTDVYIAGKWWSIEDHTEMMEDEGRMGETKAEQCRILYSTKCDAQQLRDTIWHEIKHAIFSETGLALAMKEHQETTNEEDMIRRLTPVELAVMRDNPDLMKYLLGA